MDTCQNRTLGCSSEFVCLACTKDIEIKSLRAELARAEALEVELAESKAEADELLSQFNLAEEWRREWKGKTKALETENAKLREAIEMVESSALSQGQTPPPPTPANLHAHSYGVGWWEGLAAMKKAMGFSARAAIGEGEGNVEAIEAEQDYKAKVRDHPLLTNHRLTIERDEATSKFGDAEKWRRKWKIKSKALEAENVKMREALNLIAGGHISKKNGGPDLAVLPDTGMWNAEMWSWSQRIARAAIGKGEVE